MVYLHPESLSPDPSYGREARVVTDRVAGMALYPHALVRASAEVSAWGAGLDLFTPCPPVTLPPGALVGMAQFGGGADLVLDFGTELDAALEVEIDTPGPATLLAIFGESLPEVEGWVISQHPVLEDARHLGGPGPHRVEFEARGFRFLRLRFADLRAPVTLRRIVAQAAFTFHRRDGDLRCADARFQRAWQTSAYTARLCTRPDSLWDGIKRDRVGWFGDARVTKQATDAVFFDPRPAEDMLAALPVDAWANNIPNYSFDAFAILRQHILTYGLDRPVARHTFARIRELLAWAQRTQTDEDGFLIRTDHPYFFDLGFVDWSKMPIGGRFEELCWLQCKYIEGLRDAAQIARWLGKEADAARWAAQADALQHLVVARFWREGVGFLHTLNHVGEAENPHMPNPGDHYQKTYLQGIALGPSGPSRQSNALAVWAGVTTPAMRETILRRVFDNPEIAPVITPYFSYYEQMARADCGDAAGAVRYLRDYIGNLVEAEDAATIWELYNPDVTDLRKLSSSYFMNFGWPLSLCHGWGSGIIPVAQRGLLGITSAAPGFTAVTLNPAPLPWAFEATVPTPHGPIRASREEENGPVRYDVPKEITVLSPES